MQTEAVFFDLDGTLVDTAPDLIEALQKLLAEQGLPPVNQMAARRVVSGGSGELIRFGLAEQSSDSLVDHLRPRYLELYEAGLCRKSALFSGMQEVLQRLESRNTPWGIVTNKPTSLTRPLLTQLSLAKRACSVVCADTLAVKKPHPDPLRLACRQCGVKPTVSLYIGDDLRDVEAGRAAGMRTLAAEWGYIREDDDIHAWRADSVLKHPGEILDWL